MYYVINYVRDVFDVTVPELIKDKPKFVSNGMKKNRFRHFSSCFIVHTVDPSKFSPAYSMPKKGKESNKIHGIKEKRK